MEENKGRKIHERRNVTYFLNSNVNINFCFFYVKNIRINKAIYILRGKIFHNLILRPYFGSCTHFYSIKYYTNRMDDGFK